MNETVSLIRHKGPSWKWKDGPVSPEIFLSFFIYLPMSNLRAP